MPLKSKKKSKKEEMGKRFFGTQNLKNKNDQKTKLALFYHLKDKLYGQSSYFLVRSRGCTRPLFLLNAIKIFELLSSWPRNLKKKLKKEEMMKRFFETENLKK